MYIQIYICISVCVYMYTDLLELLTYEDTHVDPGMHSGGIQKQPEGRQRGSQAS